MKKLLYILILAVSLPLVACNDDDVKVATPTARGTVVDDMGNTYEWVRIGNLEWTTSNALNGADCMDAQYFTNFKYAYVFSKDDADYIYNEYKPAFGNLMNHAEAMASAPQGWRLPSDEDWKNLERNLGMTDADIMGFRGHGVSARLMDPSSVGLLFGGACLKRKSYGWFEVSLEGVGESSFYWASDVEKSNDDNDLAYFRKIVYGYDAVERQRANVELLMSVRWCRDAQTN